MEQSIQKAENYAQKLNERKIRIPNVKNEQLFQTVTKNPTTERTLTVFTKSNGFHNKARPRYRKPKIILKLFRL